ERRDDLVGVDVGCGQRRRDAGEHGELLHRDLLPYFVSSRTSASVPVTAAAAAIAGDTRCVRPPRPWRPSKLRFEVEAQRSPAPSRSAFIARHIEHPASRHSKPASRKMRSRPSSSAWFFTRPEPGTTIALTCAATLRPLATAAAARRSSMRPLVHEPMNTLSTFTSARRVPAVSPMYSSERAMAARFASSPTSAGVGGTPVIGRTASGLVPQVTWGTMSTALSVISVSYWAPGSDGRLFQ